MTNREGESRVFHKFIFEVFCWGWMRFVTRQGLDTSSCDTGIEGSDDRWNIAESGAASGGFVLDELPQRLKPLSCPAAIPQA